MNHKDLMVIYAMNFIGVKYKWEGNNPLDGLDCSGFLCEVLRSQGFISNHDHNAQALYEICQKIGTSTGIEKAACLFFGSSPFHISHCALAINSKLMIESGGGDSKTKTTEDAIKRNAFVRIRPIKNRRDLVDSIVVQRGYPND